MQVQSIGINPQFTSKKKHHRENIDDYINMDELTVRRIAAAKTMETVNENKHKKIANAMFYNIPVVAGAATALLTNGKATFLNKNVSGIAAKVANGVKAAGYWSGILAGVSLVGYAANKLKQNSETARKFDKDHPFLSFALTIGAALGALSLGAKGINHVAGKLKPSTVAKMQFKVGKVAHKINSNKLLKSVANKSRRLVGKLPSSVRSFGKGLLAWAPDILLFGGIIHSIDHSAKRNSEYLKNYNDIKSRQFRLAQARVDEMNRWNAEEV